MTTPDSLVVERSPVSLIGSAICAGLALCLLCLAFGIGLQVKTTEAAALLAVLATLLLIMSAVGVRAFLLHKVIMVLDAEKIQDFRLDMAFRWNDVASALAVYTPRVGYIGVGIKLRDGVDTRVRLPKAWTWRLIPPERRYDFILPTTALKERSEDIIRVVLRRVREHGGDVSQNRDALLREQAPATPFTFEEKKLAVFCAAFILAVFGVVIAMAQWHEHRIESGQMGLSTQP